MVKYKLQRRDLCWGTWALGKLLENLPFYITVQELLLSRVSMNWSDKHFLHFIITSHLSGSWDKRLQNPWCSIQSNFDLVLSRKRGWPDLAHPNSNLSNSHSPSRSIHGILHLQINTLALLIHLRLTRLLWSSSLPLAVHSKLQRLKKKTCPSSLLNTCSYHVTPFALPFPSIPTSPLELIAFERSCRSGAYIYRNI